MPWKVGGNFETVAVTCERTWKECVIAVANYLWCEVVSDVVDYLTKEIMMWVFIIAIISTIFIRIKYCTHKKMHTDNIVLNKQILNKVGYKIHDLELKVNVLTYKMQYGTWPLPYQIYNLNLKKLRKNRMTLPNPDDRKKHVSQKGTDLSKSEKSILQWQNVQFLPLNSSEINRQISRSFLTQNDKYSIYSTNDTYNLCQKFTDTVYKCKSFFKELQYYNKHLHSFTNSKISSETSKTSLKSADSAKQVALFMTRKKKAARDVYITMKGEKINKMKCMKKEKDKMIETAKKIHCQNNVNISTGAVAVTNDASSKQLVSIFPINQPTNNVQSSRETLYEVKKRLRSLHNVLRAYQNISRSSERQESMDKINEIDVFTSVEKIDDNKINTNYNGDSKKISRRQCSTVNSCEYFEFDRSEENSFSLMECSSNRSKAHRDPNDVTLQNVDITKTNLFNLKDEIPEISEKICSESFKDQYIRIQNEASSIKDFTTIKCSDIFEQCQESGITLQNSCQSQTSNDSDREEKSTALLLQEALHFKRDLLTRVQSTKEINHVKEDNVKDEFLVKLNNNDFPSIIVDIKMEDPIISNSDKINQCYIHLEIKQRCDLFPKYLQKVHAFNKRNIENQNCASKTSSQYFSISNLTILNDKIGNDISSKPPVYEKVISIVIPISVECQNEMNMNKILMQIKTVLENIQARVNLQEKADNMDNNNVADEYSPMMLKFENLIFEHIKNIRNHIDIFLRSQNKAISKPRKVLQYQGKRDILQCFNKTSHIVLHDKLKASSNCKSTDQIVNSLNNSNLSINTGPKYKQQNILKCYSDMCLKKKARNGCVYYNSY